MELVLTTEAQEMFDIFVDVAKETYDISDIADPSLEASHLPKFFNNYYVGPDGYTLYLTVEREGPTYDEMGAKFLLLHKGRPIWITEIKTLICSNDGNYAGWKESGLRELFQVIHDSQQEEVLQLHRMRRRERVVIHVSEGVSEVVRKPAAVDVHILNFDNYAEVADMESSDRIVQCPHCEHQATAFAWNAATLYQMGTNYPERVQNWSDPAASFTCPHCFNSSFGQEFEGVRLIKIQAGNETFRIATNSTLDQLREVMVRIGSVKVRYTTEDLLSALHIAGYKGRVVIPPLTSSDHSGDLDRS